MRMVWGYVSRLVVTRTFMLLSWRRNGTNPTLKYGAKTLILRRFNKCLTRVDAKDISSHVSQWINTDGIKSLDDQLLCGPGLLLHSNSTCRHGHTCVPFWCTEYTCSMWLPRIRCSWRRASAPHICYLHKHSQPVPVYFRTIPRTSTKSIHHNVWKIHT